MFLCFTCEHALIRLLKEGWIEQILLVPVKILTSEGVQPSSVRLLSQTEVDNDPMSNPYEAQVRSVQPLSQTIDL
jgi:hypothetical protein